jgi:hypothetical protein
MNKKEKKTTIKAMMGYIKGMSDAYENLFKWWYEKTFAGIEAEMLSDGQIQMCHDKAKELYEEDKGRNN